MKNVKIMERSRLTVGSLPRKRRQQNQQLIPTTKFFTKVNSRNVWRIQHRQIAISTVTLNVTVNPGNVHDSIAFDGLYNRLVQRFPEIDAVVIDAGYKILWICKKVTGDERIHALPYKRPMETKGFFKPYNYIYDEYYNCAICPENQVLRFSTVNRDGYREFKSDPKICENCPSRSVCTRNAKCERIVTKHIWSESIEFAEYIHNHCLQLKP